MATLALALGPGLEAQSPAGSAAPDSLLAAYVKAATDGDWHALAGTLDSADLDAYRDGFVGSQVAETRLAGLFALQPGEQVHQLPGREAFIRLMTSLSRRNPMLLATTIIGCSYEREPSERPDSAAYTCRRSGPGGDPHLPDVQPHAVKVVRGSSGQWRVAFPTYLRGLRDGIIHAP